MFLLSMKGSIWVLLGTGLLLGLLGPADAIKCYECSDTTNDETKCLVEKDCPADINNCVNNKEKKDGTDVIGRHCGTKGKGHDNCHIFDGGESISCFCHKDLCNNVQLTLAEEEKEEEEVKCSGVSTTITASPVLALGAFLMVYLHRQQGTVK